LTTKPSAGEQAQTILLDPSKIGVELEASAANSLGRGSVLLDRFKLLDVIGEGGMSRVFKAIDLRRVEAGASDPHVAVKVLTMPFANYSDALSVLSREAHNLQGLTHPNIVRVIDCDRDGEVVFMTMELLSGRSLQDEMQAGKAEGLPREFRIRVIESIVNALEFAHSKHIVHGDLKPGNVFITNAGEIKVIDFGLARLIARPKAKLAISRSTAGERMRALTPAYASPEMWGDHAPDPRDDVYSLACVAWKVMTGEHPFQGRDPLAARNANTPLVRPPQIKAHEFRALRHALEFDREKRTVSARQFLTEFSGEGPRRTLQIAGVAAAMVALSVLIYFALNPVVTTSRVEAATQAGAAPTPGQVFRDCPTCPLMKVLPAGEFLQGSAADDVDAQPYELPQHTTSITHAFAAGIYEVTVGEYAEFVADTRVEAHACAIYDGAWRVDPAVSWKNAVEGQAASHPVSCISWQDAKDYAAWLSHRTNHTYTLLSASEWEYAARAGTTAQRPWGNPSAACAYGNVADQTAARRFAGWSVLPCTDNYVQSAPVGSFAANAFGLYDTLGNVFEWTEDCWSPDYRGAPVDGSARRDGDCSEHELRGGSWFTSPEFVRIAYRDHFAANYRSTSVGLRLRREVTP
jgi:formylglycine-generating enzyme required for sulfatase activity